MRIYQWVLCLLLLSSCAHTATHSFTQVDIAQVREVQLKKQFNDGVCVQLNNEDMEKFIQSVNSNEMTQLRKAVPQYWMIIKLTDGSNRSYKILENYVGEGDTYKHFGSKYFMQLYESKRKIECAP